MVSHWPNDEASGETDRRVTSAARDLKRTTGRIDMMVGIAALILVGGILALRSEAPGVIFAGRSTGVVPVSVPGDEPADALVRGGGGTPFQVDGAGSVVPVRSADH